MPKVSSEAAQRRTLAAFRRFVAANGRPPSIRELAKAQGLQPLSCQRQLDRLIERGYVLAKKRVTRQATAISAAGLRWLEDTEKEE